MKKKMGIVLSLVALLSFSGCVWKKLSYRKRPTLPTYEGWQKVEGLQGNVNVFRDNYGVPHVFSENKHDLFFAVGYTQAQDRLWEMAFFRAFAEGRTAELLGIVQVPGAQFKGFPLDTIQIDKVQRTLGIKYLGEVGEALLKEYDTETYDELQAYCDGVNAFIDSINFVEFQILGVKPDHWKPADVVSFGRFMGWFLGYNMMVELLRYGLIDKYGEDMALGLTPIHDAPGPTVIPPELLKNKLASPSGLIPGSALTDDQIGFNPKLSGQSALDLYAFTDKVRKTMLIDDPYASNNWAVNGKMTATGAAMLENDPHLPHLQPSIWYMSRLKGAGFDSYGVSFPGTPYHALGHTPKLAWAATTSIADAQDLFIETADPADPTRYKYKGEWLPFTVREEFIKVKGVPKLLNIERAFEVRQSIHGPIINDMAPLPPGAPPLALRWTAWDFSRDLAVFEELVQSKDVKEFMDRIHARKDKQFEFRNTAMALSRLMKGQGIDDFVAAMDMVDVPNQNWMAADAAGHIAYLPGGLVPIRNKGLGVVPAPGEAGEFDWTGFIPTMELPHAIDPERGYLVSANNEVVDAEWYPYTFSLNYDAGWRAWRIEELLKELAPIDMRDMKRIQNDVKVKRAEFEVPYILQAVENKRVTDPVVLRAAEELRQWNYEADVNSTATVIFFRWADEFRKDVLADEVEPEDYKTFLSASFMDIALNMMMRKGESPYFDDKRTVDRVEDMDDVIVKALKEAMVWVEKKYGKDPEGYRWEVVHPMKFFSLLGFWPLDDLSVGPFTHPGARDTVRCASFAGFGRKPYKALYGTSWRQLIDMSDPDGAQVVIDGSISGQWLSPHYTDMHQVWAWGDHLTATMTPEEVMKKSRYHLRLTPP